MECSHCHTESVVPQPSERINCGKCGAIVQISLFDLRETFPCPGCNAELRFSSAPGTKPEHRPWSLFGPSGWRIVDCLTGDIHPVERFPFEIGSGEKANLHARGAHAQHCALEADGKSLKLVKRDPRARIIADGVEAGASTSLKWGHEHTLRIGPHYYILHGGRRLDHWESQVDASQWFICDTEHRLMEGPYSRRELAVVLDQHKRDPVHTLIRPQGLLAGFPLNQFGEAREMFHFQAKSAPPPTIAATGTTPAAFGPPLLRLQDITLELTQGVAPQRLLHELSLDLPGGHLAAIVGASGCGKTTLLKVMAGIMEQTTGTVSWRDRNLTDKDLAPSEIGYVPQFSIAYEHLTIWESMDNALRLRVVGLLPGERRMRIERILREVGLLNIAQRQVRVLSGGERRRLSLALESVTEPALLLCDEVTSGLDPKAEEEVVELMHRLSRENNRLVISVTHSLRQLDRYDSVAVMYQGCLVYHGPSQNVARYFGVAENGQVFTELAKRPAVEWHALWQKYREQYSLPMAAVAEPATTEEDEPEEQTPNALAQFWILWRRRTMIFFRDRGQLWLHLALLFGFPCLVVIFALHGLPQMQSLSMGSDVSPVQQLKETTGYITSSSRVGSLVSGLVMFQVILLALMGSNNAAREVAAERLIFEKEKLGGLRPISYLASKAVFLAMLVAAQSIWMAVFVTFVCRFPGDLTLQACLLLLGNGAITAASLAISSLLKSPEQASLVSIYLVGFQIPLSGAFLALPDVLGTLSRPFIAAYWSWSGVVETMRETRFYDAVLMVTQTDLAGIPLCLWALAFHVVFGLLLAYIGCRRSRWD
jgi:ABC-type multidrug transport system ATPase subunit